MSNQSFKAVLFISLALTIFACSVFTPKPTPSAAEIEKEEQVIYSFFMPPSGTALILQDTSTSMTDDNPQQTMDYVKSSMKGISNETIGNFLDRNKKSSQLAPGMQLGVDYVLMSQNELHAITSQSNWGEVLNEKYPNSHGYLIFSRVGFNNMLDQALIYVGQMRGPLNGNGDYYLMEKQNGQWVIKDQIMVWIS